MNYWTKSGVIYSDFLQSSSQARSHLFGFIEGKTVTAHRFTNVMKLQPLQKSRILGAHAPYHTKCGERNTSARLEAAAL